MPVIIKFIEEPLSTLFKKIRNFWFFLPKKIYEDSSKLYAFCRVLDDIADEKTDLDHKIKKFNEMKNFLEKNYDVDNKEINSSDESKK